eukprot:g67324.t1
MQRTSFLYQNKCKLHNSEEKGCTPYTSVPPISVLPPSSRSTKSFAGGSSVPFLAKLARFSIWKMDGLTLKKVKTLAGYFPSTAGYGYVNSTTGYVPPTSQSPPDNKRKTSPGKTFA